MAELRPIIEFHGRHFVCHLGICNPICVKLLQVISGVIPSNLKKTISLSQTVVLRFTNAEYTHTQTHTHTQDDSTRRNAMRCISPKNSCIHTYNTRRCNDIHHITCRTQVRQFLLKVYGYKIWNEVPFHIRDLNSSLSFKR